MLIRDTFLLGQVVEQRVQRVLRNHGDEPRLQEVPLRAVPRGRDEGKHGADAKFKVHERYHL